jgi:hypothetical protein
MHWRRLRTGEFDRELLWLGVSVASVATAWIWLRSGLPRPHCTFHALTGCPCPTCGATRCVRFIFHGDFGAALRMNPLAFLGFGALVLYNAYAAIVLAFRLPRFHLAPLPPEVGKALRIGVVAAIALNWAWLIWSGV